MKRRILSTAVFVVTSLISSEAVYAAPAAIPVPVHALFSKSKLVSFSVRNDSAAPLKLKAGESSMTIEPGKTMPMKLAEGTRVTTEEASGSHEAGALIAQVSSQMSGVTLSIK